MVDARVLTAEKLLAGHGRSGSKTQEKGPTDAQSNSEIGIQKQRSKGQVWAGGQGRGLRLPRESVAAQRAHRVNGRGAASGHQTCRDGGQYQECDRRG